MRPRLELILIGERSFTTPRSETNITTFGEGEEFRIAIQRSYLTSWPPIRVRKPPPECARTLTKILIISILKIYSII